MKINGKVFKINQKPGSYILVDRKWKNGDKIEVNLPMSLRLVPTEKENVVAIAYGPLVLAGVMGTEGMEKPAPFSNPILYNDYYTYNFHVPASIVKELKLNKDKLSETIKPVAER